MGSYKWVISRVTVFVTHIRGLIAPLIATHETPSRRADVFFPCFSEEF